MTLHDQIINLPYPFALKPSEDFQRIWSLATAAAAALAQQREAELVNEMADWKAEA